MSDERTPLRAGDTLPAGVITAAREARYGEEIDIYTWDCVADAVLRAVAPLIAGYRPG